MSRLKASRTTLAPALAAALIVAAGGAAVASSMGFKMNKGLYPPNISVVGAGDNWIALPYNRPYATYADLCRDLGLPNVTTSLLQINPETGATQTCNCGQANCSVLKLDLSNLPVSQLPGGMPVPYLGVRIRSSNFVSGTSSVILTGSHDPAQQVALRRIPSVACGDVVTGASPNIGVTWLSLPYHTSAVTIQDLCAQLGLSFGSASIRRTDPLNGNHLAATCGTAFATKEYLALGEAVRIRRTTNGTCAPIVSIPAHY